MPYRVMIVDDEEPARLLLQKYVEQVPELELAACCTSAIEANGVLQQQQIDILLLDIQMELLTGLELLKSLPAPPATILTTAYSEYALDGYELDVVDYLVKPITFDRFFRAINKAKANASTNSSSSSVTTETSTSPQALFIKSDQRVVKVEFADLHYLESYGEYVKVHTKNGMLLSSQTMTHFEEHLPSAQFYRIHRTYLINMELVQEISGNQVQVAGKQLIISKRQKEGFLQALQQIGKFF